MKNLILIFFLVFSLNFFCQEIPEGFVEIREVIPDIILDLRYLTNHNFLGVPVEGYIAENCYITKACLLYTSPSPRDRTRSRMPSSA